MANSGKDYMMFGKKVKIAEMTTILGKGTVVNGDFTAVSSARVDGVIEGDVKIGGLLIVGESGQIHGNIEAASITVGGEVLGDILAPERCELITTAKVIGDITTKSIVIDEKAIFQGALDMYQESQKPAKVKGLKKTPARTAKRSAKDVLAEAMQEANASVSEASATENGEQE